jgi:hypothetical protein
MSAFAPYLQPDQNSLHFLLSTSLKITILCTPRFSPRGSFFHISHYISYAFVISPWCALHSLSHHLNSIIQLPITLLIILLHSYISFKLYML